MQCEGGMCTRWPSRPVCLYLQNTASLRSRPSRQPSERPGWHQGISWFVCFPPALFRENEWKRETGHVLSHRVCDYSRKIPRLHIQHLQPTKMYWIPTRYLALYQALGSQRTELFSTVNWHFWTIPDTNPASLSLGHPNMHYLLRHKEGTLNLRYTVSFSLQFPRDIKSETFLNIFFPIKSFH